MWPIGHQQFTRLLELCAHESSGVATVEALGVGTGTVTVEDFERTDLILIFGNNPCTNDPRMLTSLEEVKRHGARIIAVNPLPETGMMRVVNPPIRRIIRIS